MKEFPAIGSALIYECEDSCHTQSSQLHDCDNLDGKWQRKVRDCDLNWGNGDK